MCFFRCGRWLNSLFLTGLYIKVDTILESLAVDLRDVSICRRFSFILGLGTLDASPNVGGTCSK